MQIPIPFPSMAENTRKLHSASLSITKQKQRSPANNLQSALQATIVTHGRFKSKKANHLI